MCFTSKSPPGLKEWLISKTIKKATHDIVAYKIVYPAGFMERFHFKSSVQNFKYKKDRLYTTKLRIKLPAQYTPKLMIDRGFHAYTTRQMAGKYRPYGSLVVEVIFPKRCLYARQGGYIVADSIIIKSGGYVSKQH